jgi:hypothetical protein
MNLPACRPCNQAFNTAGSRDNHGYLHHGKPATAWKATTDDLVDPLPPRSRAERKPKQPKAARETSSIDALRNRPDRYAGMLKDDKPSESADVAKKLPWLKMPTSIQACEKVADECADLASKHRKNPELREFFLLLREHVIAVADHKARWEKAQCTATR